MSKIDNKKSLNEVSEKAKTETFNKNHQDFQLKIQNAFLKKYSKEIPFTYRMDSIPFTLIYDRAVYSIEDEYQTIIKEIWDN